MAVEIIIVSQSEGTVTRYFQNGTSKKITQGSILDRRKLILQLTNASTHVISWVENANAFVLTKRYGFENNPPSFIMSLEMTMKAIFSAYQGQNMGIIYFI